MSASTLFVGSMPMESTEDVLQTIGAEFGAHAACLPDGETGDRSGWSSYLPITMFGDHPDLVQTRVPEDVHKEPDHEQADTFPGAEPEYAWTWAVKPGVEELSFGDLGYAAEAAASYAIFSGLRDEGKIPAGVRFQVSLPATSSAIDQYFDDATQWPVLHRAYAEAIGREIQKILKTIPAEDLAIQFDMAWEVVDLSIGDARYFEWWPETTYAEKFERHARLVAELCPLVPEDVLLGLHCCYGTWGGWPMTDMRDLSLCVDFCSAIIAQAGRQVDWVHMPVSDDPDDAFLAPLDDLDWPGTRVYLGLVHLHSSVPCAERVARARRHLADFGVAGVCGFGRERSEDLQTIIDAHRRCIAAVEAPPAG